MVGSNTCWIVWVFTWGIGKMITQKQFKQLGEQMVVSLFTDCPEKFLLIDRETGNVFIARETGEWELIRDGSVR